MDPMITEFIGVLVRWAITTAIAYLVSQHILTEDQGATFAADFTHKALISLPLLAPLAWGLWVKYRGRVKLMTALSMPANSTENDVKTKIALGQPTPSVLTPPNTVPGVPK